MLKTDVLLARSRMVCRCSMAIRAEALKLFVLLSEATWVNASASFMCSKGMVGCAGIMVEAETASSRLWVEIEDIFSGLSAELENGIACVFFNPFPSITPDMLSEERLLMIGYPRGRALVLVCVYLGSHQKCWQ